MSLLNEHPVMDNKSESKKEKRDNNKAAFLKSIETELSPNLDEDNLKQGEIGMANAPKRNFNIRRPVNVDINRGTE